MKKEDERIKEILERRTQDFDKKVQRAELLARNKMFLKELKGISERLGNTFFSVKDLSQKRLREDTDGNILLELDYPKVKKCVVGERSEDRYFKGLVDLDCAIHNKPKNLSERIWNKNYVLGWYISRWEDFCDRWHIDTEWNGKPDSLSQYQRNPVEIYCDENPNTKESALLIRINEWATIEDIRAKWGRIEELQNEMWGKKEIRTNFSRDLCWYDLAKKCSLRASQIANLWAEKHPEDIDLLVARRIKREIIERDLKGRDFNDSALVKQIKAGYLSSEYKAQFEEERKFYITGETEGEKRSVKITAPFVDVIKKAIKRMEKQIKKLDMLPTEHCPIGLPPQFIE